MSKNEEIAIVCSAVARAVKEAKFAIRYPFGYHRAKRHFHLASNAVDQLVPNSMRAFFVLNDVCNGVCNILNEAMYRADSAHLN